METGVEALAYLETCNQDSFPELMFVDVHMPFLNGFEFVQALNQKMPDLSKKATIFMLSSSFMQVDIHKINEFPNVYGFIEKPFSKEIFDKMVAPKLMLPTIP